MQLAQDQHCASASAGLLTPALPCSTRDVLGPIAKTVTDAALALDAMAAFGTPDFVGTAPEGGYTGAFGEITLEGARIGTWGPGWNNERRLSSKYTALYGEALDELQALGATIVDSPFQGSGFGGLAERVDGADSRGIETIGPDFAAFLKTLGVDSVAEFVREVGVSPFDEGQILGGICEGLPPPETRICNSGIEDPAQPPDTGPFLAARAAYRAKLKEVFEENQLDAVVFPQAIEAWPPNFSDLGNNETTAPEINILGVPSACPRLAGLDPTALLSGCAAMLREGEAGCWAAAIRLSLVICTVHCTDLRSMCLSQPSHNATARVLAECAWVFLSFSDALDQHSQSTRWHCTLTLPQDTPHACRRLCAEHAQRVAHGPRPLLPCLLRPRLHRGQAARAGPRLRAGDAAALGAAAAARAAAGAGEGSGRAIRHVRQLRWCRSCSCCRRCHGQWRRRRRRARARCTAARLKCARSAKITLPQACSGAASAACLLARSLSNKLQRGIVRKASSSKRVKMTCGSAGKCIACTHCSLQATLGRTRFVQHNNV